MSCESKGPCRRHRMPEGARLHGAVATTEPAACRRAYFGELIVDCLHRTEKAMTQEHTFLAIELALIAQASAMKIV